MKRIELFFSALLVPVDYLMIVAAGLAAYFLRVGDTVTGIRPVFYALSLSSFASIVLVGALGWLVFFALSGLYTVRVTKRFRDEATAIFLGCSTSVTAVIVLFFFQREFFSSRFIILTGWLFAILFVTVGRLCIRRMQRTLLKNGIGGYRVALVGDAATTRDIIERFTNDPGLGYRVITTAATIDDGSIERLRQLASETVNGSWLRRGRGLDLVIQADPNQTHEATRRLLEFCREHHVAYRYVSTFAAVYDLGSPSLVLDEMVGLPMIEVRRTRLDGWGRIMKRTFDVALSALFLVAFSPLYVVVALLIKVDSPGPVFYRSERVGEHGRKFFLFKFRSMVDGAHALKAQLLEQNERQGGPLFKMKNDPRVTRIGRILRRTSIDELPQCINVFRGDMSLVGPRPHEPGEVARYERHQKQLLAIRPGITGLAQVSGRSDLPFGEEARIDISYIEHWSLLLDLIILVRTPRVVLSMKSAA